MYRKHSYWKIQQAIWARRRWQQSRKAETLRDTVVDVVGNVRTGCALPRAFILSSGFVIGASEEERESTPRRGVSRAEMRIGLRPVARVKVRSRATDVRTGNGVVKLCVP